jgi:hypothetical protein
MDELPNNVLVLLLNFVKKHAPAGLEFDEPAPEPVPTVAPAKPRKNKPMSKHEQEAKISMLQENLQKFKADPRRNSEPGRSPFFSFRLSFFFFLEVAFQLTNIHSSTRREQRR